MSIIDNELIERVRRAGSDNVCPLCGEDGFDAYGLRAHFVRGWCEVAEAAEEWGPRSLPPADGATPDPSKGQDTPTPLRQTS